MKKIRFAARSNNITVFQPIFGELFSCFLNLLHTRSALASRTSYLDLSEDENPPLGDDRLTRSYDRAIAYTTSIPASSQLYRRIIDTREKCPFGVMPCGGPALSKADIETIRRWIVGAPSRPYTHGDPHLRTIEGVNYDFQAAGEFVLLRGQNLEIQARHTAVQTNSPVGPNVHTGLRSSVSLNTAVAVRVGRQRITYQPHLSGKPDPEGLQLRVDGELMKLGTEGIPLAAGARIMRTTAPGGIQIEALGGSVIIVTPGWWDHYQLWYLNIDARHVRATQGLMGAIAPGNWLPALPDGSLLGSRPPALQDRHDVLYGKFGRAWRVTDATSLFDYAPDTSTDSFTVDDWPGRDSPDSSVPPPQVGGPLDKAPQEPITLMEAEKICRDIVDNDRRADTIKDVMVTGEPGFARTNLLAQQILLNALPAPPVPVFPEDNQKILGRSIQFRWEKSTDPDGDTITYRHYVWPVNEQPDNNKAIPVAEAGVRTITTAAAELKFGTSYFWKVIAEDGKGGTAESITRRFEIE